MEKSLLKACIKRDERSCLELYKRLFGLLMGVSMRYQKNEQDAKEVVQTSFMKILNSLEKIDLDRPVEGWARQICIHANIDYLRSQMKYKATIIFPKDLKEADKLVDIWEENGLEIFDYDDLLKLVHSLPDTGAQVFNLYVIDGFKHQEIADILGISEGTSRWYLSYCRKLLQEKISQEITKFRIATYGK